MSAEFEIRGAWPGDEDRLDALADEIGRQLTGVGECVGYDQYRTEQGPVVVFHVIAPEEGAVQPLAETLGRETGVTWVVQPAGAAAREDPPSEARIT